MMSLNSADALRRKLEEEHDFNAEQANGTMMVVDEMVENGFDRMHKSIDDLRSDMHESIASLRSEIAKDMASLRSDMASLRSEMDAQFQAIDKHFKLIEYVMPVASAFFMIAMLATLVVIADGVVK